MQNHSGISQAECRSDVGLAIKRPAFEDLPEAVTEYLYCNWELTEHIEGHTKENIQVSWLFTLEDAQWDRYAGRASALLSALEDLNPSDYVLLEAQHERPNSTVGNRGGWGENPWGLRVINRAQLEWDYTAPWVGDERLLADILG
jgi:hypothetical protein